MLPNTAELLAEVTALQVRHSVGEVEFLERLLSDKITNIETEDQVKDMWDGILAKSKLVRLRIVVSNMSNMMRFERDDLDGLEFVVKHELPLNNKVCVLAIGHRLEDSIFIESFMVMEQFNVDPYIKSRVAKPLTIKTE